MPETAHPVRKTWPPNGHMSAWIASHFAEDYHGYCVDVGASDGISVNSTYLLEKERRWTVVSVEPNPIFHPLLKELRAFVQTCACDAEPGTKTFYSFDHNPEAYSALRPTFPPDFPLQRNDGFPSQWTTITVPVKTLEQILAEYQFPRLDALCVDVEGNELDVLKGIDLVRWRPKAMVLECWVEGELDEYVRQFGYRRIGRDVHNDLFVKDDA